MNSLNDIDFKKREKETRQTAKVQTPRASLKKGEMGTCFREKPQPSPVNRLVRFAGGGRGEAGGVDMRSADMA